MTIRLRYFSRSASRWFKPSRTRTLAGWAFHLGPLSLYINTDRLP